MRSHRGPWWCWSVHYECLCSPAGEHNGSEHCRIQRPANIGAEGAAVDPRHLLADEQDHLWLKCQFFVELADLLIEQAKRAGKRVPPWTPPGQATPAHFAKPGS
jgi:hypothetical protein